MKRRTNPRFCYIFVCFILCSLLSIRAAGTLTDSDVAIVVNPSNPTSNMTLADLRKIFMGERQYWKASNSVVPLMRSQGTREREVILRVVFQMTEQQYGQYWVAKVMRAEVSDPPASLFSNGMVQEGVKGNAGAIGYISAADVRSGVKVVRVGGLLPGEPGYALR
ncbi:MAG TPA: substrate-binding domain-containing protein [Candidatus Dormibacteraeota bacterium]|nr:substrate-binding domain-containing protein [Candidatus Dormibacteraeota bacterium]